MSFCNTNVLTKPSNVSLYGNATDLKGLELTSFTLNKLNVPVMKDRSVDHCYYEIVHNGESKFLALISDHDI